MDVLILIGDGKRAALDIGKDRREFLRDLRRLLRRYDALFAEHMRVSDAALYIFPVQSLIKSDGVVKCLDGLIGLFD